MPRFAMRYVRLLWFFSLSVLVIGAGTGLLAGRTVQLLEPYDPIKQRLTGEPGVPVGAPLDVLILSTKALIDAPAGRPYPFFDRSVAYPIQMRTFWFIYIWAVIGLTALSGAITWCVAAGPSRRP